MKTIVNKNPITEEKIVKYNKISVKIEKVNITLQL